MSLFETLKNKALKAGATEFGISKVKNKKYYVIYNEKKINFGDIRFEDYTIHKDKKRRLRYRLRHKAIKTKTGAYAYLDKTKPAFWSYHILW